MKLETVQNIIKPEQFDVLVVGAGLSGVVVAEQFANVSGKRVLVIDKREHIAGNCFDYYDENEILVSKYGAHLFHTKHEDVWDYVRKFGEWQRWDHRVIGNVEGMLIPIPININTVNAMFDTHIENEEEMDEWLKSVQVKYDKISNSEEVGKSRVGEYLYAKIFRDYTYKQWNKYPEELDVAVLSRIPIRNNFDDRYFSDRYQALPKKGYSDVVKNILTHPNITVSLAADFFKLKDEIDFETLIFTGQIDQYFGDAELEKLEYRSIEFIEERYKSVNFYQTNSVVNYPENKVPFTRIVEYKHFLNQESPNTTIVKELTKETGEPYYPVLNDKNMGLYSKYKELADSEFDVHFMGRLASYKYFNMDQAIKNSLDYFKENLA